MATSPAPARGRTWFGSMNRTERRTFWACFGGWATDAADVQMFSLLIPVLLATGFLHSTSQAGLIGTVTLLSSAVGGWLAGTLADRFGRVRMLQVTVLWFSVFTLLCGLAQDPVQLGVFRALMGLGFGGEWAVGAVLMAETVRPAVRGRAVGTVQSGWAVGWGVAAGLFVLVSSLLPPELAWRALFALGVLPALLVIYLRRHVSEPETAKNRARQPLSAALKIFEPGLLRRTLLASLLCLAAQGGYYAMTTWLPQFLAEERGLKILALGGTLGLVIAGSFAGYLVGAWLADVIGRKKTLLVGAVGAFLIMIPFILLDTDPTVFTLLCFPLGAFASVHFSAIGPLLSEQFPTEVRGSGQGFCYNFGRGVGALFPFAVGALADRIGIAIAIAVFAGAAYTLLGITAVLVQEARGADLDALTTKGSA